MTETTNIARWQAAEEGQFFERKSALDRSGGARKPRKAAAIAHDIAEALAAFANADGGELVVGIEDDGTVWGCRMPTPRSSCCWASRRTGITWTRPSPAARER